MDIAKGTYISFLDDDDLFLPNHLETGIQILEETPEIQGVYFDATVHVFPSTITEQTETYNYGFPWNHITQRNPLISCAMIFRKNNIRVKQNVYAEDYLLWKMFHEQKLKILHVPIITCIYRRHLSKRIFEASSTHN